MSGLEIAGVLLGAFPLIISSLEHWRDIAKVGGFFWRIRKEYATCVREVRFYELIYKRNLKELLIPIVVDKSGVKGLIDEPGGKGWSSKDLQERLQRRLHESYDLYQEIICEMNDTVEELRKILAFDKATVQSNLIKSSSQQHFKASSSQSMTKSTRIEAVKKKIDFETFRLKFSFNEPVRNELLEQLKKGNERLEKLLSTSDQISSLESTTAVDTKYSSNLATTLQKAWKRSDHLFKAIHKAWSCSCQQYHFANLRLEHRRVAGKQDGQKRYSETCFEIIFMFIAPSHVNSLWSSKAVQCGEMSGCASLEGTRPTILESDNCMQLPVRILSTTTPFGKPNKAKVTFASTTTPSEIRLDAQHDANIQLCQLLGDEHGSRCLGIIGHNSETYHLHPTANRQEGGTTETISLDHILSRTFDGHFTRRQRYSVALHLASSIAQLQFTPWLNSELRKEDILFFTSESADGSIPYHQPFIRQGFPIDSPQDGQSVSKDCDFSSLGILLLELCFGQRLEDQPLRMKHQPDSPESKQAFNLMAALKWCQGVRDEGGDDYAAAVQWCFFSGAKFGSHSWRVEFVDNVIVPLERCQECFKTVEDKD